MLPRRARYATGKERTMDDGRKDAAAGMEADSSSSSSFAGDTNYATKLFHPIAKRGYARSRRSQNIFMG